MPPPRILASSNEGFFQDAPTIQNQYEEDASLRHAMLLFLPDEVISDISVELTSFGNRVLSPQVLRWMKDTENNPPKLETWDTWGRRKEELITSNGWQQLQALGICEGIVAIPYENRYRQYDRLYQFFKYHVWSASSSLVTCPSAMTDGAAALLRRHLDHKRTTIPQDTNKTVLRSVYSRLTSRNPDFAWTSGQWMTERPGGSNIKDTETRASLASQSAQSNEPRRATDGSPLGPWTIDGFKWFSSATDADMSVLLAKTSVEGSSQEQISAFFAPTRCCVNGSINSDEMITVFNGIRPQRLKSKLGTRPLPTAELELQGMRAYLLGEKGQGVREISTVLNITRMHNAVSAMGGWGRGLAVSRAFARVRRVGGQPLIEVPAHARDLAQEHVKYRAYMLFTYFVAALLGAVEHASRNSGEFVPFMGVHNTAQAARLLRLLTPVLKATTAQAAIDGLRYCMESMGGIGYLENEDPLLNVARLFRDANVLAIWEGTSNVMAEDTIRVLQQSKSGDTENSYLETLCTWASGLAQRSLGEKNTPFDPRAAESLNAEISNFQKLVPEAQDTQSLLYDGKQIVASIDFIVTMTLLGVDSQKHGTESAAAEIARRWSILRRSSNAPGVSNARRQWKDLVQEDFNILADYEDSSAGRPKSRL